MLWIALGTTLYLAGYAAFVRLYIYDHAKRWKGLPWDSGETVGAFYFGLMWPIIMPLLLHGLYRLKYPATPKNSLFARIHAKDRARP